MTAKRQMDPERIRVLIAESHAIFRCGIEVCLAETRDLVPAGQTGQGADVRRLLASGGYDVLLLDTSLSGLDGFGLLKQIKEEHPRLPVLLMAGTAEVGWLLRGIRAGALGVVSKDALVEEFQMAIRRIAAGHPYIAEALAEKLVLFYQRNEKEPLDERLSPREFEVMQYLAAGLKLSEIARRLRLSHQTITTHRRHILEKTGLRSTAEIIRYGILHGLGASGDASVIQGGYLP